MQGAIPTQSHNPLRLDTPPGSTTPTLFEQWCGFFYVPQEPDQGKCCETEPTVFRPCPRRMNKKNEYECSADFFLANKIDAKKTPAISNKWSATDTRVQRRVWLPFWKRKTTAKWSSGTCNTFKARRKDQTQCSRLTYDNYFTIYLMREFRENLGT